MLRVCSPLLNINMQLLPFLIIAGCAAAPFRLSQYNATLILDAEPCVTPIHARIAPRYVTRPFLYPRGSRPLRTLTDPPTQRTHWPIRFR